MEKDRKDRLLLLLIFGSIILSVTYINNTVIDGISFQDVVHRYIPFVANYNPVTVGLIFIIVCFALAFLISDKSIPSKHQHYSGGSGSSGGVGGGSSKPKPIVQDVVIRTVVEQPANSSGHVVEQAETRPGRVQTQKTHHPTKQKKLIIYNYYDRRNRKRFHW